MLRVSPRRCGSMPACNSASRVASLLQPGIEAIALPSVFRRWAKAARTTRFSSLASSTGTASSARGRRRTMAESTRGRGEEHSPRHRSHNLHRGVQLGENAQAAVVWRVGCGREAHRDFFLDQHHDRRPEGARFQKRHQDRRGDVVGDIGHHRRGQGLQVLFGPARQVQFQEIRVGDDDVGETARGFR